MSLAYWCVLFAAVFPYLTIGAAKATSDYDNANPRAPGTYAGWASRAHAAHQNGFEVFPFFAVAVLVASGGSAVASLPVLNALALAWAGLRLVYAAAYVGNLASLRSIVWIASLGITIAIFTLPAWHG